MGVRCRRWVLRMHVMSCGMQSVQWHDSMVDAFCPSVGPCIVTTLNGAVQEPREGRNSPAALSAKNVSASAHGASGPSAAAVQAVAAAPPARRRMPSRAAPSAEDATGECIIDLTGDDGHLESAIAAQPGSATIEQAVSMTSRHVTLQQQQQEQQQQQQPKHRAGGWACPQCTLANVPEAHKCQACGKARPLGRLVPIPTAATPVHQSGGLPAGIKVERYSLAGWHCKFCTLCNDVSASRCGACGEWRYASGAQMMPLGL